MQLDFIDSDQVDEYVAQCTLLMKFEHTASTATYLLQHDGFDVVMISRGAGGATVIYPPDMFDAEREGSIHDNARALIRDAEDEDDATAEAAR